MDGSMTFAEKRDFLSNVPLFHVLDDDQLDHITRIAEVGDYPAGDYICREGEMGRMLYVILDGAVGLEKDGVSLGAYRRQGDCVGELTLLDEQPRSASLRASTHVRVIQLHHEHFNRMLSTHSSTSRELLKVLSMRLRESLNIQIKAIRKETERTQELKLANQIQHSLLPETEIGHFGIRTAGYCQSADTVGGDYYDYIPMAPDRLGIVIADVMGHGFHSAMFVAMVKSCLQTQIRYSGAVSSVVNAVRKVVEDLHTGIYFSMCYIVIHTSSRVLTYTNAGHPFPLHYRRRTGCLNVLESTCTPLGIILEMPFPPRYHRRRQWDTGDILLLYSDGVTETQNADGEEFGEKRLQGLFLDHVDRSAEEIKLAILEALTTFSGEISPKDDITLVVVQL